jgi:hypothetical protein
VPNLDGSDFRDPALFSAEGTRRSVVDSAFQTTLWLDPQGPHAVHDLDRRPVRLLRVELKP